VFLTNNSPDICVLTLCIIFRKNNLFSARLPRISANLNENYRRYNFQALANISGNFQKIHNPKGDPAGLIAHWWHEENTSNTQEQHHV